MKISEQEIKDLCDDVLQEWHERRATNLEGAYLHKDARPRIPGFIIAALQKTKTFLDSSLSDNLDRHKYAACAALAFQKCTEPIFYRNAHPLTNPKESRILAAYLGLDLMLGFLIELDQERFYSDEALYGYILTLLANEENKALALSMIAFLLEDKFRI